MNEELKPCPFCSGYACIIGDKNEHKFIVECQYCYAQTSYFKTEEYATEAWNRRA